MTTRAPVEHRFHDVNGLRMHVALQGSGPPVLLLHGFPETWFSWRHQMQALAERGFCAIAPDLRGFGRTGAPAEVEQYDLAHTLGDVVALLDVLGLGRVPWVGHDWGATLAWQAALLHPERIQDLACLSVPYTGRPLGAPLKLMEARARGTFFYILYFQEPGVAEAEMDRDVRTTLAKYFYSASGDAPQERVFLPQPKDRGFLDQMLLPEVLPAWLEEDALAEFVKDFQASGFRGGLNWYRNIHRNWEATAHLSGKPIPHRTLFIVGERDPVLKLMLPRGFARMEALVPNLAGVHLLPGCGHWTQQERPAEVNRLLLDFLGPPGRVGADAA